MWGPNPSLLREKLGGGSALGLYVAVLGLGYAATVPQPLLPVLTRSFSPLPMCRDYSASFRVLSEGIVLCLAMGGSEFGSLQVHQLGREYR